MNALSTKGEGCEMPCLDHETAATLRTPPGKATDQKIKEQEQAKERWRENYELAIRKLPNQNAKAEPRGEKEERQ